VAVERQSDSPPRRASQERRSTALFCENHCWIVPYPSESSELVLETLRIAQFEMTSTAWYTCMYPIYISG